jgi:hypothetical protein
MLRCEAVRWIGYDPLPGLVEVAFTDAAGTRRSFVDKVPIFDDADRIQPDGSFPVAVYVDCEVLATDNQNGREVVTITTQRPWSLETQEGLSEFQVLPQQLVRDEPPTPAPFP